jgi:hypothetical protein
VSRIVLDAGALIALERSDKPMWAVLKLAALRTDDVLVPSTVVAQVWRGGLTQALLGRALRHCILAEFDELAREVGLLCRRARTSDICDAHVALVAATRADVLYTSDVAHLRRLISVAGRRMPRLVRC